MLEPTDALGESCRDVQGVEVGSVVVIGIESLPFGPVEPAFEPLELLLFETVFQPLEPLLKPLEDIFEPEESVRSEIIKLGFVPSADLQAKGSILSMLLRVAS